MFVYDETGSSVLSYECEYLYISNDIVLVQKDGLYGVIDLSGKVLVDFLYDDMTTFIDGYSAVEIDGRHGVINDKGEFVIEVKYENIVTN